MNRRHIGFLILGFWLVMMGLLLHRERGGRRLEATAADGRLTGPTTSRMGLFLKDGKQVGEIRVDQRPESRGDADGVWLGMEARTVLHLLGKSTELELDGEVWRSYGPPQTGQPRAEFGFRVRSAEYDFRIDGDLGGGRLRGEVQTAGETFPLEIPVADELFFSSGLGPLLELPRLEVGEEVRIESFDPLTMSKSRMRVHCEAHETLEVGDETVTAVRLRVDSGGLRSVVWIDGDGEIVQAETPIGLVLRRLAPEASTAEARTVEMPAAPADGGDLLGFTAIRPRGRRPFRGAASMVVQLAGVEELELPSGPSQQPLGGGRYRLAAPSEPGPAVVGDTGADLAAYLRADAFVQSDHLRIRGQASSLVGDESDSWRRALAIHQWVYTALEKEPVVSIPSALEVLEKRRGDCNEHTVLFTALARAAGIPTRIAIGLVWSDELDGFYYHAWPEVHTGAWIRMDPTLDQPLADATHLKLLTGGIERWPQLLPFLGRLEIEVLEIE